MSNPMLFGVLIGVGVLRGTFHLPIPSPSSQNKDPSAVPLSLRGTISPRGFFRLKKKSSGNVCSRYLKHTVHLNLMLRTNRGLISLLLKMIIT